jgi:carbonic anhydrase
LSDLTADRQGRNPDRRDPPPSPARRLAVIACMDSRLTVEDVLGLSTGDAHVIRNAGGLATDDAIRSLVISQNLLGTEHVIVIEHTGCGMLTFLDEDVRADLAARTGAEVDLPLLPFADLERNLREQVERIRAHPWLRSTSVRGMIYEIETGRLREVE